MRADGADVADVAIWERRRAAEMQLAEAEAAVALGGNSKVGL